ncbi:hypothetical protein Tco_0078541 [Tanacetum coccineum]
MEDPEQAFVEYASSRTDEAGDARFSKFEAGFKQQQSKITNKIDTVLKVITDRIAGTLPSDTVKNPKLSTYPVLSARSYPTEDPQCSTQTHVPLSSNTELICIKEEDGDVMFIEIVSKDDKSRKEKPEAGEQEVVYFDVFPTRSELVYHNPNENNEVAYKMPHKIEQYDSLSNLEKEHTKSVYLRNEEDKRRGVEYVMSKILGFYKECLELGPEYLIGMDDEGEVT